MLGVVDGLVGVVAVDVGIAIAPFFVGVVVVVVGMSVPLLRQPCQQSLVIHQCRDRQLEEDAPSAWQENLARLPQLQPRSARAAITWV